MTSHDDLQFLPLGVGDFFSRHHYCSSFVVLGGGDAVLVDCPSPLRKMLHEATARAGLDLQLDALHRVVLTHLHGDHANGLEELAFYKRFFQGRKPEIYTIPEVAAEIWDHRLKAAMGVLTDADGKNGQPQTLNDYFDIRLCQENGATPCGPLRFDIRRTRHFLPCFGFRIACGEFTLGYSADTQFDLDHIDYLAASDVIIHETSAGSGHTPVAKLAELPETIRNKMFIIHVPDTFDIATSPIPVLEEGRLYSVRDLIEARSATK